MSRKKKASGPEVHTLYDRKGKWAETHVESPRDNPAVVIYGNPRVRPLKTGQSIVGGTIHVRHQLAKDLHEIRYTHAGNGDDFKHPFEGNVQVWAIERDGRRELLITHPEGLPVWDLFED